MKYEWLNNGEPFPAGHRKAGQLGIALDFEDGRPEPQNVYAADKDAMLGKITTMYGNTQVLNARLYGELKEKKPAAGGAGPTPAHPAADAPAARMTPGETIQAVADLDDPAKAGEAIVALVREASGIDLTEQKRKEIEEAETERLRGVVRAFMDANQDYYPSPRNARLLRNSTYALADGAPVTLGHFQQSFDELLAMDALESKPTEELPGATTIEEPTAPHQSRPRPTTGIRPSALSAGARPGTSGTSLTYKAVMDMAGTDEYEHRLKYEPGFRQQVEKVLEGRV